MLRLNPKQISNDYTNLASGVLKVKNGKTQQEKMKDAAKIWNDIKTTPKPKPKKNNTQLSYEYNREPTNYRK